MSREYSYSRLQPKSEEPLQLLGGRSDQGGCCPPGGVGQLVVTKQAAGSRPWLRRRRQDGALLRRQQTDSQFAIYVVRVPLRYTSKSNAKYKYFAIYVAIAIHFYVRGGWIRCSSYQHFPTTRHVAWQGQVVWYNVSSIV